MRKITRQKSIFTTFGIRNLRIGITRKSSVGVMLRFTDYHNHTINKGGQLVRNNEFNFERGISHDPNVMSSGAAAALLEYIV